MVVFDPLPPLFNISTSTKPILFSFSENVNVHVPLQSLLLLHLLCSAPLELRRWRWIYTWMVLDAQGVACGKAVCDEGKTAGMRGQGEVQGWREAKESTGKSTKKGI